MFDSLLGGLQLWGILYFQDCEKISHQSSQSLKHFLILPFFLSPANTKGNKRSRTRTDSYSAGQSVGGCLPWETAESVPSCPECFQNRVSFVTAFRRNDLKQRRMPNTKEDSLTAKISTDRHSFKDLVWMYLLSTKHLYVLFINASQDRVGT